MSNARLVFAGALLCISGVAFAQSPPATPSTVSGIFQNPPAASAADAKSGASASTPGTDQSARKTFNESRSNALRTPGDKAVALGTDPSGNKSYYESRSNTANRAPGDATTVTPGVDPSAKKTFNESRSNIAPTQPAPK